MAGKVKFLRITLDAATDGVAVAKYYLSKVENRKVRPGHVKKLADLMISGKWQEDASAEIVITKNGYLKEGRHRLLAFIEAAKYAPSLRISFYVKTGVPDEQAYAIQANVCHWDCGDILEASGMDRTIGGIVKLIMSKGRSCGFKFTHEKVLEQAKALDRTIRLVRDRIRDLKRIKTAAVVSAIVRGLLATEKKGAILRFCDILSVGTGAKTAAEEWAEALNTVLNNGTRGPRNSKEVLDSYLRTEAALNEFLNGTPYSHGKGIRKPQKEVFSIQGESIFVPNDGTRRFLLGIRGCGYRSKDETLQQILLQKTVSLQGKVQRKIPPGAKLALATLADKKVVAIATVKRIQQTQAGVPEAVLLNVEKTEPKGIDFSKLSSYPRIPNLSKEIVPITASDMENLTA